MSGAPPMANVEDVIADGDIHLRSEAGALARFRVRVGRPRHLSDVAEDDWCCPVWIDGFGEGVRCFGGADPVDALMNAMDWVRSCCGDLESPSR